jgi:hypothetical protein
MPTDFLKDGVFEPEETALMGEAFESACKERSLAKHRWARELVAARIIAAVRRGELDPVRLRTIALAGIGQNTLLSGSLGPPSESTRSRIVASRGS